MTSLSLLQQLRAALWPLLSYWLLNLLTFGLFTLSLMLTALDVVNALKVMGVVGIAVGLGLVIGQLFAFFRVRTWLILSLGALSWGISFYLTVISASAGAAPVAILLGVILLLTPVAAWGGMWSLETNRSMWSLWLPLVWFTGAVLIWADKTGKDSSWSSGAKAAIWDPLSIIALVLTLFLLLAFLVSRESHRLKLWAAGPSAPLPPRSAELTGAQASASLGSSFLLLLLAPMLAAGVALITPYFWRVDHDPEKGAIETDGDGVEDPSGNPDKNGDRSKAGDRGNGDRSKAGDRGNGDRSKAGDRGNGDRSKAGDRSGGNGGGGSSGGGSSGGGSSGDGASGDGSSGGGTSGGGASGGGSSGDGSSGGGSSGGGSSGGGSSGGGSSGGGSSGGGSPGGGSSGGGSSGGGSSGGGSSGGGSSSGGSSGDGSSGGGSSGGGSSGGGSSGDGSAEGGSEGSGGGNSPMERMERLGERAVEAGKEASTAVSIGLLLLVLSALAWLVGYRPVRRLLLLRHLRDPLWQVSPTTRVEQGWRMVEIALGDVGVEPLPGEDASGLARRALPVLQQYSAVEVHGMAEAAAAADRVRFGLGVTPADVDTMERFSAWTLDTIWERLSEREQLKAMYRAL